MEMFFYRFSCDDHQVPVFCKTKTRNSSKSRFCFNGILKSKRKLLTATNVILPHAHAVIDAREGRELERF